MLFWLQLKLEDFAWLKAILQAAKGNTLPFGDVGIAAIGDVFQLPAIGGASVYAGAASFVSRALMTNMPSVSVPRPDRAPCTDSQSCA